MTRDEAVKIYRTFGLVRVGIDFHEHRPAWWCEKVLAECAEDTVDGLIALGILDIEEPIPVEASEVSDDR